MSPAPPTAEERARHRRESAEARRQIRPTMRDAHDGNRYASFGMGVAFTTGSGVPADQAAAAAWYALAASQGHEQAATLLGSRFIAASACHKTTRPPRTGFDLAPSSGDRQALTALGLLYAAGRGVPQDLAMAIRLWIQAGDGAALRLLGDAYACGFGVELNLRTPWHCISGRRNSAASSWARCIATHAACRSTRRPRRPGFGAKPTKGIPRRRSRSARCSRGAGVEANPYESYHWAALAAYRLPEGACAIARWRCGTRPHSRSVHWTSKRQR